ncbi:MAG TPA: lamin tail domain-containing protein, partial [Paludibacter sp.]|nr:lamin tail domain-containing protein [Paludibacter sp.]
WKSGAAQFGYGSKGEKTVIGYGGNASNKYTAAYFRKTIRLSDLKGNSGFSLKLLVDDGAVVYINGQELGRYNLPSGAVTFNTLAVTATNGDQVTYAVPQSLLKEGENLVAVEVHQNAITSSDLIFDLQMTCQQASIKTTTAPVFSGTLTGNISLKAIYEAWDDPQLDDRPPVQINEIVSSNTLIADEFGEKDDYIELYNSGDSEINVGGWFLTDMPSNRQLAQIPATDAAKTTIPAKGRIVVWADGQTIQGVLHTGFKLGKEGEAIVLSKTSTQGVLVTIDSVAFPAMGQDMSYSRMPDGSTVWMVQAPTMNQSNLVSETTAPVGNSILVYPTLATEQITVERAGGKVVRITDLAGKVIVSSECRSDREIIQVGQLRRGLYIVTVGNSAVKMVKL